MTENQTQPQTPKAFILSFPYRRTGMGGFDDTVLLSFRTRKVIKSILRTTRSGNHGTRQYRLLPGKYLQYSVSRSNGGNLYADVAIIRLNEEGTVKEKNSFLPSLQKSYNSSDLGKTILQPSSLGSSGYRFLFNLLGEVLIDLTNLRISSFLVWFRAILQPSYYLCTL